ncbi:uncharacterized protein TRIREDRAFT_102851 [Trichoderma reesei QM6a]|uniref:Predicted protein n=1 Tax=Hypocrea jecorina (strain QM6a) TaxID=431241 RepID=G0R8G2_HYPJQ|nr:uncharacterized protein TRIREDRAFT_102851 [Trichoderma reesei QM6a]EGR52874.1 predicted protein [Trichoderma reesei QM6a]
MAPHTAKALLLTLLLALQKATAISHENAPETIINNNSGCTSTMTLTQSRLPTPPYWPQCSWDGTLSIYSSTVTVTRSVDCRGCANVRVTEAPVVHCPAKIISTRGLTWLTVAHVYIYM